MSSSKYSTQLRSDERLRNVVTISGALLGAIGLVLLLTLPLPGIVRALAAACWLIHTAYERRTLLQGYRLYRVFRVDQDGVLALQGPDQDWVAGELRAGSVVLGRMAWLRVESTRGERFAELFVAGGQNTVDWRRLQVIWRHIGAAA